MRILLIGPRPPPSGGQAAHIDDLAAALGALGVAVGTIDPRRGGPRGQSGRLRLAAALAMTHLHHELVHVHINGHNAKSWLLSRVAAWGHRSLVTVHSGFAPAFIRGAPSLVERALRRQAAVVAVNPEIADALAAAGVPRGKIHVAAAFSPRSLALRLAPPGLSQVRRVHQPLLACALAPGAEYGADVLFDALAALKPSLPRLGVVVYGAQTRSLELAAAVRSRGLGDTVHFFGELSRPCARGVVAAADLFVRPTRTDGDALSVREALALGTPVVASDVGLRPREATLFPVGDSAALTAKIFHAVTQPVAQERPTSAPAVDCVPLLLALYRRCWDGGWAPARAPAEAAATLGTGIATS